MTSLSISAPDAYSKKIRYVCYGLTVPVTVLEAMRTLSRQVSMYANTGTTPMIAATLRTVPLILLASGRFFVLYIYSLPDPECRHDLRQLFLRDNGKR
jgi:hypothetical protein